MRYANSIKITVFVKPEDKTDNTLDGKILDCIKRLFPTDLENERLSINKTNAEGFNNRNITIYELSLTKESHTNMFIKNLRERLNQDQKDLLFRQAESRLDENLDFFIRLGKQELLRGDYYITDSGDCFHIRIGIAAFPRKKETALKVVEEILFDKSANI
jgi:RNA binding exosome subunit